MQMPSSGTSEERYIDAGLLEREGEFLERRRRLNRSFAALFLPLLLGVPALLLARRTAPETENTVGCIAALCFLAVACVFLVAARRWRCPQCAASWKLQDGWASAHWLHCHHCGVELRSTVVHAAAELDAMRAFGDAGPDAMLARFRRRQRLGMLIAAVLAVLSLTAIGVAQARGWSEISLDLLVGLGAGLVTAAAFVSARCPRCQRGIVARDGYCARCGLDTRPPEKRADSGSAEHQAH
jgi:hypothetical protein